MSWSEFVLRSQGFSERLKREELLAREVAYQSYCAQFTFSKKKPKTKEKFWPIKKANPKKATNKAREVFEKAWSNYKQKVDGRVKR